MDGVGARALGHIKNLFDFQVGFRGGRWPDMVGLIRLAHVQRRSVHVRVDGHRRDSELPACADHPYRDLSTVGDEDLFEHLAGAEGRPRPFMPSPG